jgi:hypothetical protein
MTNTPSIVQLQSDWFSFSDLDRARAVLAINKTGISTRKVAAHLHLSEPLLRHLLHALQAPASDQDLARQGKISTSELVRRAKAGLRSTQPHETLTIDRDREIRVAADLLCDWLLQTQLCGSAREAIVKEVRHKFTTMKEAGLLPPVAAHPNTLVSRIIERTKPAQIDGTVDIVAWFAQWLCSWTLFAFPDEDIRDNGLSLAQEKQRGS